MCIFHDCIILLLETNMAWKWLFFLLLAIGLGVIVQNETRRKQFLGEVQQARLFINKLAERFEGWQIIFLAVGATLIVSSIYSCLFREDETLWNRTKRSFFRTMRKIPWYRAKIEEELEKALNDIEKDAFAPKKGEKHHLELPAKGLTHDKVLKEVDFLRTLGDDNQWKDGFVSGALYNCSEELTKLTAAVYGRFAWSNPLHPDVFPYIRKMEAEVVQWTINFFNGGKEARGTMTSGGTESIILAMRVYREIGYEKGIEYPEIVCPISAHCAFNKAADYFRMKITQIPVDPRTRKVNLKAMAKAISRNTVVLVGSAPQFPHGIVDPIEDIAKLARKRGIGVHVDSCLGGFLVPFMKKAGFEIDPFDFQVPGVTSISADTHKYGYAPKGTSVVMYANKELCHRQYFIAPNWQGGLYATATISGSRAGGLIAATWATMMYMGEDGYVDATRKIVTTARKIQDALKKIPGIYILGSPRLSVIAVGSNDFNIYCLFGALTKRGWNLNALQFPGSFHICLTLLHTKKGVAERFIKDIRECTAEIMKNPDTKPTGTAALYGTAQTISDRSIVTELSAGFIDLLYKASPPSN